MTLSRQQLRRSLFKDAFRDLRQQYGGEKRKTLRLMASARAKKWFANDRVNTGEAA